MVAITLCVVPLFYAMLFLCYGARRTEKYKSLSQNEIQDLITQLWYLDEERVKLDLNFQNAVAPKAKEDNSPENLLTKNDQHLAILSKPTVRKLFAIFQLYRQSSLNDLDLDELAKRSNEFLDEVLQTPEFQLLRTYLSRWGYGPAASEQEFRQALHEMWFDRYPRKKVGKVGSSGFQHVFVGEIDRRGGVVSGLHNWLRYEQLETKGSINYAGYINPGNYIASIRYTWDGRWKMVGSMFFGTSPEFDMAVFTLCYLTKPGMSRCSFLLADCTQVRVTSMKLQRERSSSNGAFEGAANKPKNNIATVYPEVGKVQPECNIHPLSISSDSLDGNSTAFIPTSATGAFIGGVVLTGLRRLLIF